ncbi:F14J16.11 [Arabidopsis thaliana]|nr:F14J16.11 [Arabidopsis thaliana]
MFAVFINLETAGCASVYFERLKFTKRYRFLGIIIFPSFLPPRAKPKNGRLILSLSLRSKMRRHKRWPLRSLVCSFSSSAAETVTTSTAASATAAFPLKHVTRSNFETTLNDLRSLVKAADFVAIDLEMTGVTSAPWRDSLEFDRYDVRYLKVKDSAEKFAVVQFGVCPFRWDSRTQSFVSYPHNFFVFPRQELTFDPPAHEFLCQTTSMDFLAKYQREEEEASKRLKMLHGEDGIDSSGETEELKLVRLADVLFAARMEKLLNEWRSGLLHGGNASSEFPRISNGSNQSMETVFHHMRPALSLKGFTSHQLRVLNSVLRKHFGDLVYIHSNDKSSSSRDIVVYTDSDSDKENLMKEAKDERKRLAERKIQSAIGFRQVIDLLASEKKLIVGHNCFLDIAHVYSKFVGPLPSTAEKFVASINSHFPYIVDTKILLNVNPMLHQRMKKSSTSLSSAFSSLCPQIEFSSRSSDSFLQQRVNIDVEIDNVRCSNWNAGGKHEAGYDAFMTGCIFAQACNHLGFDFKQHSQLDDFAQNEKLEKYINRLYLSWTRELVWDFLALKRQLESSDGPVSVLHPLSKILEGGNTGAADYEAYKEICSSHVSEVMFSDQAETVGVKSRTRPNAQCETETREENTVTVTHKASDLIDAFLANRVEVETATSN